ncbi:hypothetical protein GCK72_000388 [Caenorhabditis remanei]|uniref:Uncharacterized protein n=1 Tax=Caenorhabditis remanei TaxID=31234 RepID=A0A6A5HPH8_CAERE|nr:hypothetical protein GCK72_000388 [Caenorhabditis remanei]KAF1768576.1 hypothetical protein GCK72_000388 [Caenorhabditis remanei]
MHHPSTPVKRSSISKITGNREDGIIKGPSDKCQRRISAPIDPISENRVAPSEIFGAPKISRVRESVPHTPSTTVAAAAINEEGSSQTPRRRSTQLVMPRKTPTKTNRRHSEESFGASAPFRPQRVETRELSRDSENFNAPIFLISN